MAKMMGRAFINVNGNRIQTDKGASLKPGGDVRKAVMSTSGFCGHQVEEIKPSEIKYSVLMGEGVDVVDLQSLENTTVVFEGDDGQSYLCRSASTEGEVEVKDGKADVTMTGAPAELI